MKISNFILLPPTGSGISKTYHATIDVTTGWFFKTTVTRRITKGSINWFFDDTGEWTPNHVVEYLERAYMARESYS